MKTLKMITLISTILVLISCSIGMVKLSDPRLIDTCLTKTYPYSVDKCFLATQNVFRDLETQIESIDEIKKTIITKRTKVSISAYGSGSSATLVTKYHKYYLEFIGNDTSCTVRAFKYKVWTNNTQLEEISPSWEKKVWNPFFNSIAFELEDM